MKERIRDIRKDGGRQKEDKNTVDPLVVTHKVLSFLKIIHRAQWTLLITL
jgi:hypothetical protein